jgi:regulator of protease activity HflC (stomatin/prohibitin superfamily)
MESALAWIGQVAEWIGQFFPHLRIVTTTHSAVKFVRGNKVVVLAPGWHWYWPFFTHFEEYPTARQAIDLRAQTIVTTDDKVIAVSALVVYEIADIEKILAHTYDPDDTIRDISLGVVHDVVCQYAWEDLKAAVRSGKLDRDLRAEMKKGLDSYGVRVIRTTLTDLGPCQIIKLLSSGGSGGIKIS